MSSIHANTRRLFKDNGNGINKPFKGEINEFPQVQILRQKANRKKVCYLKAISQILFYLSCSM